MSPPSIRVNTFVIENDKPHVDPISKMFIVSEVAFGLNRLPLMGRKKFIYIFMTFITYVVWIGMVLAVSITSDQPLSIMMWSKLTQNSICTILSFSRCKLMLSYYFKLNNFDTEAACRPKVSISCIRNSVLAGLTVFLAIAMFTIYSNLIVSKITLSTQILPLELVYILEVYYIGHLLGLLVPRLKLINYYIESSLSDGKMKPHPIFKEFVYINTSNVQLTQCHMGKLMDLYEIVVEAYDFLYEGIKWQLLAIIISGFTSSLGFLYNFCIETIQSGEVPLENVFLRVGMVLVLTAPLFAPCTLASRVHSEVKKLRELLASKLYENKLDKSGRSVARALLSFTETRDLSFRLLRMLNIDISLPFKFSGLIITYLIILLQFEKVIHP